LTAPSPFDELDPQLVDYLHRGWLLLPCSWHPGDKRPLIKGGIYAAANDLALVTAWWRRWRRALWAICTGKPPLGSGIAIVDVDKKHGGFETLARLLGPEPPPAPTVLSPSGGEHRYYLAPPGGCFSTVGIGGKRRRGLGPGLDLKCDLSMCHAPGGTPASPYRWHELYNLVTTPLLPLPTVLTPIEVEDEEDHSVAVSVRRPIGRPDAYAERALSNTCERIRNEPPGTQRKKLNDESLQMGQLAAGLGLDHQPIIAALVSAGMQMANEASRPPWRLYQVRDTVLRGFRDGLRKPYAPQLRSSARRGR
jgi:hypothetical protein